MAKARQTGGTRRGVHLTDGQAQKLAWLCQRENRTWSNMLGWLVERKYEEWGGPPLDPPATEGENEIAPGG